MTNRLIFTINFTVPNYDVEPVPLTSSQSLLDADIILFQPGCPFFTTQEYQGKPLLSETHSFKFVELLQHWRGEIVTAISAGRTVIVFLNRPQEYFVYTGEKKYSGTGRNRQTTDIVASANTYDALPRPLTNMVARRGSAMRLLSDARFLASYWNDYASRSSYEVYFEADSLKPLVTTRSGEKPVGALLSDKGNLLLLPSLELFRFDEDEDEQRQLDDNEANPDEDEQRQLDDNEANPEEWSQKQLAEGYAFVSHILELDRALQLTYERTPPPAWVDNEMYNIATEKLLQLELEQVTVQIEALSVQKNSIEQSLIEEGSLRRLLYEQGHELEAAILDSLQLLGFKAEQFQDGDLEFDSVFVSSEGRFLGEAEGKDNKAINIDKLSQLERNLQDDFNRDEVTDYAKGVLFANAFRLTPLNERADYFTDKCIKGAQRLKVALVRTPDLFRVAQYLKANEDESYAQRCRQVIKEAEGVIAEFPQSPTHGKPTE